MKITTLLKSTALGLALFAAPPAFADAPATENQAADTAKAAAKGPALWKVADEDTTIYLFGTVHVLPEGVDWYDERIATALESADLIVKELGADAFEPAKVQAAVMKHGVLSAPPSLRDRMSDEQRAIYEAQLPKMGLKPEQLDVFQPWFVATRVILAQLEMMGIDSSKGVEATLEAKAPDTPRAGLETVDLQFAAFASLPVEQQMTQLMGAFEDPAELEKAFAAIVDHWIAGDVKGLGELINEAIIESGLEKPLLYDRNANWAVWIDERLEQPGVVFMAVGAGHLAGKNSVQDMLEQREITVTRVQ